MKTGTTITIFFSLSWLIIGSIISLDAYHSRLIKIEQIKSETILELAELQSEEFQIQLRRYVLRQEEKELKPEHRQTI